MQETITSESLFCDYYAQWVKTYKEGAIRDVTMGKYRLTQSWLGKLIPELRLTDMDRTAYQQLINGYAQHHERQTTMDFHHQIKGAILDAVDEGLIPRDPTRKVIIKGKQPRIKKMKYLNQFELHAMLADLDLGPRQAGIGLSSLSRKPDSDSLRRLGSHPMTLISHTRRFPSTKLGIIKTAAVSYPRKTNRPYVKCNSTGNSSCKCLDYSRIFRMINLFSCTARSTTQQPTTCLQNIAETWTCQLFPSMVYAIHTHRCCCSPAYRSPACHAV